MSYESDVYDAYCEGEDPEREDRRAEAAEEGVLFDEDFDRLDLVEAEVSDEEAPLWACEVLPLPDLRAHNLS